MTVDDALRSTVHAAMSEVPPNPTVVEAMLRVASRVTALREARRARFGAGLDDEALTALWKDHDHLMSVLGLRWP